MKAIYANIAPCNALKPFVLNYSILSFNTNQLERSWPCYSGPEMCLLCFIKALPTGMPFPQAAFYEHKLQRIWLKGLFTDFCGNWKFKGEYTIFRIHFTPTGFHSLFQLSLREFTNKIVAAQTVFGNEISCYAEDLQQAQTIANMAALTDEFLTTYLIPKKATAANNAIAKASHTMLDANGSVPIEQHASLANMSLRNFERKFRQQVGTSPKIFCRLLRFNRAIHNKLTIPDKCWTSIALECDYYDQMHMIRDFKKFAGSSPTQLFENSALPILHLENIKREFN
ncbi:helix-turn-helix domain-containing protein [Aequorivita lipolytica]|uniref:helix-turn-helix domain-containing protein n=1 Tax=Aequorivita lipolytica TaxID=153267 RepID=UPI00135CAE50|nr:helix-turn-helix domain-containing protein [Aequorivita lipolytica]